MRTKEIKFIDNALKAIFPAQQYTVSLEGIADNGKMVQDTYEFRVEP